MSRLQVITVGSALRDVSFYSDDFHIIHNPVEDPTVHSVMGGEFGAKLRSDEVYFHFGGGASNTAVNFAGLGVNTGIITALGDDLDGEALLQHFNSYNINTALIARSKKYRTGFSFLTVDKQTREHVAHVYYGATQEIRVTAAALRSHRTDWFYITSLNMPTTHWRKLLNTLFSQPDTRVAWNPGGTQLRAGFSKLRRFLAQTSLLILNSDEARELILSHPEHAQRKRLGSIDAMARLIRQWGPEMVVITDGRHGSCVATPDGVHSGTVPQDTPKDTTGAGDCFGSSFLTGIIRYNGDAKKSLKLATYNSSNLVKQIGAQHGLLTWKQLPKRFK